MQNIKKFNQPTFEEIQPGEWLYDLCNNFLVHVAHNSGREITCWVANGTTNLKHYRRLGKQVKRHGQTNFNGSSYFLKDGHIFQLTPKPNSFPEFGCLCSAGYAKYFGIKI